MTKAHSSDFHMSYACIVSYTYDTWIFTFACLCTDDFYPKRFGLNRSIQYFLQLFTIIAYYFNAHIIIMRYVIYIHDK